jgi:hypothetical protein
VESLRYADLESAQGISSVEQAAVKLQLALNSKVDGELQNLNAITERLALFGKERTVFAMRLTEFLRELIRIQVLGC